MKTGSHGPAGDGGCSIESRGDVNIYNCAAPCRSGQEGPPPQDDHACPPVAPGACVPVSLGSKPKQRRRRKLDKLLANTRVPSALGPSFFHLARRHLAGKAAANPLEEQAFAALRRLPPDLCGGMQSQTPCRARVGNGRVGAGSGPGWPGRALCGVRPNRGQLWEFGLAVGCRTCLRRMQEAHAVHGPDAPTR